jgi:hypothetical protein
MKKPRASPNTFGSTTTNPGMSQVMTFIAQA